MAGVTWSFVFEGLTSKNQPGLTALSGFRERRTWTVVYIGGFAFPVFCSLVLLLIVTVSNSRPGAEIVLKGAIFPPASSKGKSHKSSTFALLPVDSRANPTAYRRRRRPSVLQRCEKRVSFITNRGPLFARERERGREGGSPSRCSALLDDDVHKRCSWEIERNDQRSLSPLS
ncbi:hypothetical protein BHE74_00016121 [Ensete ventricosum]|nr:hypothetical protein BHE74_00016121 [Ensete ventricosum]